MRSDAARQRRRAQDEAALGPDGGAAGRGQGHPVAQPARPSAAAARPAPAKTSCGTHGVERLEALEGDDHDVALLHGSHCVRPAGLGVNDLVPTDSAMGRTCQLPASEASEAREGTSGVGSGGAGPARAAGPDPGQQVALGAPAHGCR